MDHRIHLKIDLLAWSSTNLVGTYRTTLKEPQSVCDMYGIDMCVENGAPKVLEVMQRQRHDSSDFEVRSPDIDRNFVISKVVFFCFLFYFVVFPPKT